MGLFLPLLLLFKELELKQQGFRWIIRFSRFLVLSTASVTPGEPDILRLRMPSKTAGKFGAPLVLHSICFLQVSDSVKIWS